MRGRYGYLPILRAKAGEFSAVSWVSPQARSRLTPLFDVSVPSAREAADIDTYLADRAEGIYQSCGPTWPVYVDVHDLPSDQRTSLGAQPLTYVFERLRMHGATCVPVTGTEEDRVPDFHVAVKHIVARDRRGACLRLAEEDVAEPQLLGSAIDWVLTYLALQPSDLDIVIDLRYVGDQTPGTLRAVCLEALQAIYDAASFRNVVLAGGSVPEKLVRKDEGSERRERRIEWDIWSQLVAALSDRPLAFGDHGIIYPYYASPNGTVIPPARIRYTLAREHVFYRAPRGRYAGLCRQLIASDHFAGQTYCVGDDFISRRARGLIGTGNPTNWVAVDTNHHLELVSEQAWRRLSELGLLNRFTLPEPGRQPWLQTEIDVPTDS